MGQFELWLGYFRLIGVGKEASRSRGEEDVRDHSHPKGVADGSTGGGEASPAAVDAFFTDLGKKGRSLWGRLPGF